MNENWLTDSTLFKALDGLRPVHGGDGRYPGVGRWTEHLDPDLLWPCVYGYHLAIGQQILDWLGPTLYEAEPCPDHDLVVDADKLVTCRVRLVRRLDRWDETTARLFAADCAESALLGERASGREPDYRSWAAVDAARQFARGEISSSDLFAARDAAWDAAWSAAWADGGAVEGAAWAAAKAASRGAAWAAARGAAWAASRAAGDAAEDADEDVSWAAAKVAQYRRLRLYLEGAELPPVAALYGEEAPGE